MIIQDTWSDGFVIPKPDPTTSDVVLEEAGHRNYNTSTSTYAVFRRKINSCDGEYDQRILPGIHMHLSWARGSAWGRKHDDSDRGSGKVILIPETDPMPASPISQNSTQVRYATVAGKEDGDWDLKLSNVTIPAHETSYLCRHFEVPFGADKVHVTRSVSSMHFYVGRC
jgi:hypothetical protein